MGFDEAYTLYQRDVDSPTVVNQRHDDVSEGFIWGKARTGTAQLVRNGVPFEDDGYLPDTLTSEAISFMEAHRAEILSREQKDLSVTEPLKLKELAAA